MDIQRVLGSDIAMCFDQCPPGDADAATHELALRAHDRVGRSAAAPRRARRARRCSASCRAASTPSAGCATWPRSPRSTSTATRSAASRSASSIDDTYRILDEVAHLLPAERPRYLMGVGTPPDLERGSPPASTCSTA